MSNEYLRWQRPDGYENWLKKILVPEVRGIERNPGEEYPRYIMVVDEKETGHLIELLNPETAYPDVTDEIPEYLCDYDGCGLPPGIYQVTIKIDGCGPDISGEYDSWIVFMDIKKYKLKDEDLEDFEPKTVSQW